MKVLILGSNSQIRAYLTEYLNDKDHEVFEYDIVNCEEQDLTQIPNLALDHLVKE
jgi:dTDP-4-dehydrorhamnose reductase